MPLLTFPFVETLDIREDRGVEDARCAYDNVCFNFFDCAISEPERRTPLLLIRLVFDELNISFKSDGVPNFEAVTDMFQIAV